MQNNDQKTIAGAILVVGILIAGAILLKDSSAPIVKNEVNSDGIPVTTTTLAPVEREDRTLGNPNAKVVLIMYEDFQCPFCGAISGLLPPNSPLIQSLKQRDPTWTPFMPEIIDNYVKNGSVLF